MDDWIVAYVYLLYFGCFLCIGGAIVESILWWRNKR